MQTLKRAFRTSNSMICNICKNDYLPGQIVFDKVQNLLRCNECDFEMLYGTKIYPGEKPHYTPFPPNEEPKREKKGQKPQLK